MKIFNFAFVNGFNLNANLKKDFRIYFIIRKIQFFIVKIKNYYKKNNWVLLGKKKSQAHTVCVT